MVPLLPNGSTRTTFNDVSDAISPHTEWDIPSSDHSHTLLADSPDLNYPISQNELIRSQTADLECQTFASLIDTPGSQFSTDWYGFLARNSKIYGSVQMKVHHALVDIFLYLSHYPVSGCHPGVNNMYDTLRRYFYYRNIRNDVSLTGKNCHSCAKTCGSPHRHQHNLKLFQPNETLEFLAMCILGPLQKTDTGNRFVLFITNQNHKLTKTVPLDTQTASVTAYAILTHWVYDVGNPKNLLTDNGSNIIRNFFSTICSALIIQQLNTSAFHPQTNSQAERYNRTILLRHYVT